MENGAHGRDGVLVLPPVPKANKQKHVYATILLRVMAADHAAVIGVQTKIAIPIRNVQVCTDRKIPTPLYNQTLICS